jgi:hypothetical protein
VESPGLSHVPDDQDRQLDEPFMPMDATVLGGEG